MENENENEKNENEEINTQILKEISANLKQPIVDDNQADQVNVGGILGGFLCIILVVFVIVFIATNSKGQKKETVDKFDNVGTKFVYNFNEKVKSKTQEKPSQSEEVTQPVIQEKPSDDELLNKVNEKINEKTNTYQPNYNQSTNIVSDRPDTRNSKSSRIVEGIKGSSDYEVLNNNKQIMNNVMANANYRTSSNPNSTTSSNVPSKEQYIAQLLANQKSSSNDIASNKESFFNNSNNIGGNGTYLSYTSLWDGTIISGALITAISTDNPGIVIARVTENVYSSYDGSVLLIPEGSLLYATYNSSVSYGQKDVQVAWNLLIRPDGYRLELGNMNGVNAQGASGYKGRVSNHPFATLKALGLIAIFSVINTEINSTVEESENEYIKNAITDVYTDASKLSNRILEKALDIKPTIKIKEGTEIKLITNIPLELPPMEIFTPNQKYVRTR